MRPWSHQRRIRALCRRLTTEATRRRSIIAGKNPDVNAFVCVSESPTSQVDDDTNHSLPGWAVAVKDNICTSSMPTTCSSGMLKAFSSPYDATVVTLLRENGADIIGKTNCDEFGMGSLNIHSVHGPVINPLQAPLSPIADRRSAGGSSGGSAAAVASGMCHAALGTDTGGSTRLPASYCGVVGLKPSYGLISRWGVVSFADSLDCVGVMAETVSNTRRVFDVLNVHDPKDPTSSNPESRQKATRACEERVRDWKPMSLLRNLRIGIPQEYFPSELSPTIIQPIRRTIAALTSLGATVIPVSLASTSYALSAYYVLASAEASSNMARYDGIQYGLHVRPPPGADFTKTSTLYAHSRSAGFGLEVKRRILLGTYALTADAFDNYFLQAQRVRQLVKDDFNRVFLTPDFYSSSPLSTGHHKNDNRVDVLIHPSAIRTAPPLSEKSGLDAYVQDVLTVPASLAGVPALSVPVPAACRGVSGDRNDGDIDDLDDGWPIGISVVGQWGCDELVLKVGEIIESLTSENHQTLV